MIYLIAGIIFSSNFLCSSIKDTKSNQLQYSNISWEANRYQNQYPVLQNMLGETFKNKRKSNQVFKKKRLIFDKSNNENLSTADFLDGNMKILKGINSKL